MYTVERTTLESLVTPHEAEVAARALETAASAHAHRPVVVLLSGAHAYGFPSKDSDLDLKGIHVGATRSFLGLGQGAPTVDHTTVVEGVELDYTTNELGHALAGILSGNGNYIERVLGRTQVVTSPILEDLRPLVKASLSRRLHAHYRGFSFSQQKLLAKEPTAKKLLYVLRTALTGIVALETGRIEVDIVRLAELYPIEGLDDLVMRKTTGENVALSESEVASFQPRIEALLAKLDAARATSVLPDTPTNTEEIDAWLVALRVRLLG
jgi:uncharacterized protein